MVLHLNIVVDAAKLMSQSFEERLYQWLWRIGSDVIQGQNTEACAKAIVCIKVCWVIHSCVHWGVHWGAWAATVLCIGMAMGRGRVWVGFLHTRTRPTGLDPQLRPGQIINRVFFPGPKLAPLSPTAQIMAKPKKKNLNEAQIHFCLPYLCLGTAFTTKTKHNIHNFFHNILQLHLGVFAVRYGAVLSHF